MTPSPDLSDAEIEALIRECRTEGKEARGLACGELCEQAAKTLRQLRDARKALEQCATQFQFYADEHTKAGKIEKAATNQRFADLARAALGKNSETANTQLPDWPGETGAAMSISWIEKDRT